MTHLLCNMPKKITIKTIPEYLKSKEKTFKNFKEFLAEECYRIEKYKKGEYDRKIFNWFNK